MPSTLSKALSLTLAALATATAIPADKPTDYSHIDRDQIILLNLKADVTSDPTNALADWQDTNYLCTFNGVQCTVDKSHQRPLVIGLEISHFGLAGNPLLIDFLPYLEDLTLFRANTNNFTGPLSYIPLSPALASIDVSYNHLNGSIPSLSDWKLDSLKTLDLGANAFTGSLPGDFFQQEDLYLLYVSKNPGVWGPLPDFHDTALEILGLNDCAFTGKVPKSIGNAKKLEQVDFSGNPGLEGAIPEELCSLPALTTADFTGTGVDKVNLGPACQKAKAAGVLKF